MNHSNIPVQSLKTLIISIISAILLSFFILAVVVGPAEFGIDPTGLGTKMGLTVLAKSKSSQADSKTALSCPAVEQLKSWKDVVIITVPANSGLEYKFSVMKNDKLTYEWATDGAALYFDFHGEAAGDTSGYFKSFKESIDNHSDGILHAPFTGSHGWYWKNETQRPVIVTLKTRGKYTIKGLM